MTLIWPLKQSQIYLKQKHCFSCQLKELLHWRKYCLPPGDRIATNDRPLKHDHSMKLTFRLLLAQVSSSGTFLALATQLYFICFFSVSHVPIPILRDKALILPHPYTGFLQPAIYCYSLVSFLSDAIKIYIWQILLTLEKEVIVTEILQ